MDISFKTSVSTAILILATHLSAQALDVVYSPASCPPENLTLQIHNSSAQYQRAWTQVRFDEELIEKHYDLAPRAEIKIPGTTFLPDQRGFSLKSLEPGTLQFKLLCDSGAAAIPSPFTSPRIQHKFPFGTRTVKIDLLNLFLKSNTVQLKAFSARNTLVDHKEVFIQNYYDTVSLKWTLPSSVQRIEIQGEERLSSFVFYEDLRGLEKQSPAIALAAPALDADPGKVYFLVSTKSTPALESFVIAMDDPKMINTAREQIRNPALEKIVVAGIELGHGNYNRSFSAKDRSPYSWSVHRVDAFADFAHIDCDGSPDLIEERLYQKLNEGGRICFWRYRVTRELTHQEVISGQLKP